jgi:hypothetical protein
MFVSIQHPSGTNATQMRDAAGNLVRFNRESAIVIARKEFLGGVANSPLPVTFNGFTAVKNGETVVLQWGYFTDEKDIRFEVQRMAEGGNFETIKTLTFTTTGTGNHTYIDATPVKGKNYYRIRALQSNGKDVFTNIRIVSIEKKNISLVKTFPNPVNDQFTLMVKSLAAKQVQITVFGSNGTTAVLQQQAIVVTGLNTIQLDTRSLAAGVYFVQLVAGEETIQTRFVKQ